MPRARLTPQSVTETGAALIDEIGFENLSMGLVAERLGVKTPALYKHVASQADLAHRIAVRAMADFADAIRGTTVQLRHENGGEPVKVRIPPGAGDGDRVRVAGHGAPGRSGSEPGDLIITVRVRPHAYFERDGLDLRLDLPISLYEAVLGGKVRVPTLGGAVELSIPKNTSSGRVFRLKGKGLPKAGGAGDLFVTTRIILPDGNDAELEALMEKWRDGHPYNPRSDFG
jgi:AcrR family transcriptional regulator